MGSFLAFNKKSNWVKNVTEVVSKARSVISISGNSDHNWYEKADNYKEGAGIMQMSALFLRNCFRVFVSYIEYSLKMSTVN